MRELLARGATVHALVRDPAGPAAHALTALSPHIKLFKGDFYDAESIAVAAQGTRGAFINPFPDFSGDPARSEGVQAANFVDAARAAGTTHLVISTSLMTGEHEAFLAADPNYPLKAYHESKIAAEAAVVGSGLRWTVLRPPWLFQNYLAPQSDQYFPALSGPAHELATPIAPDMRFAHLDAYDVGRFAAAALFDSEKFNGQIIKLGGALLSVRDAAAALSKFAGREVPLRTVDVAEVAQEVHPTAGMRAAVAAWQNKQGGNFTPAEIEQVHAWGVPLNTFEEFLEHNKEAAEKTLGVESQS